MVSLGIDCSGDWTSIALLVDDTLLAEGCEKLDRDLLAELIPLVQRVMGKANIPISAVDVFAVTTGPGSWTGIRVGVATVKALAHALKRSLVGVNTLDMLASTQPISRERVYPVVEAGQGTLYVAGYSVSDPVPLRLTQFERIGPGEISDHLEFPARIVSHSGEGFVNLISEAVSGFPASVVCPEPRNLGVQVARLGARLVRERGSDDPFTMAPQYQLNGLNDEPYVNAC